MYYVLKGFLFNYHDMKRTHSYFYKSFNLVFLNNNGKNKYYGAFWAGVKWKVSTFFFISLFNHRITPFRADHCKWDSTLPTQLQLQTSPTYITQHYFKIFWDSPILFPFLYLLMHFSHRNIKTQILSLLLLWSFRHKCLT